MFEPGKTYHVQTGSIEGHAFVIIDGALALEVTDPDPIDVQKHGLVGFEAYCSHIQFRNLKILRAAYEPRKQLYEPEF